MKTIFLVLLASIACYMQVEANNGRKVLMCNVKVWGVYRPGQGKFNIADIDPFLCTHIIYSYRTLNSESWKIESEDNYADYNLGNLKNLINLKKKNSDLKIIISLGGWNEKSVKFSKLAENNEIRKQFINNTINYLKENQLDGLDIDWVYPTRRGGKPDDKQNYVTLLQELRLEFDKSNYILTARLMGSKYAAEGYDLRGISRAVHYINLKSYDYHGFWEKVTGVYAAISSSGEDNVEFSINYFLEEGVQNEKLLLGLSTEGNAYLVDNPNIIEYIGKKSQSGFRGPWLGENGALGFNEICWNLTRNTKWKEYWDDESFTPYSINDNMFTSYDNKESYEKKLDLIDKKSLAGVSLYSLDTDDFKGLCYNEAFIVTKTVKQKLGGDGSKLLMCNFRPGSITRPNEGKLNIDEIDPHLCTHIIYSHSSLNSTNYQIDSLDFWADYIAGNLKKLVQLKSENSNLKIISSIGGWDEGSEKYSKMAESEHLRQVFITSVVKFLEDNHLDGLDFNWNYPTKRGGKLEDKENFVTLLQELRSEFDKKNYILTARLMGSRYAAEGYDLGGISKAVHYINLKSYEYHGTWERNTGIYAAYSSGNEDNIEFSIDYFLQNGIQPEKLLLGLSTDGNAFLMDDPYNIDYIGKRAKSTFTGPWLRENGVLGFNEICWNLTRSTKWKQYWDKESSTPYSLNDNMFTSYDNKASYVEKLTLIESKSLGGVSLYSLDTDDFKGLCYNETFYLTNTVKRLLNNLKVEVTLIDQNYPVSN